MAANGVRRKRLSDPRALLAARTGSRGALEAAGKALRVKVPRESLAAFEPPRRRMDPVAILEAQAKTRLPQLIPGALRADVDISFCLPSWLGRRDGAGLESLAYHRPDGSGVRRHAPVELRRLRLGRAQPRSSPSTTSTRPSPGPVGVGPQAPGGEHRRRRPISSAPDRDAVAEAAARVRREAPTASDMRDYAAPGATCDLWYAHHRRGGRSWPPCHPEMRRAPAERIIAKAKTRRQQRGRVLAKMTALVRSTGSRIIDRQRRSSSERQRRAPPTGTAHRPGGRRDLCWNVLHPVAGAATGRPSSREYRLVDVARKVVGVGSVGTRCLGATCCSGSGAEPTPSFSSCKEAQALGCWRPTSRARRMRAPRVGAWSAGQRPRSRGSPDVFPRAGAQAARRALLRSPAAAT